MKLLSRRVLLAVVGCVVVVTGAGCAACAAVPSASVEAPPHFTITLSEQDRRDLKRIEDYFNTLPPLFARFTQDAQLLNGDTSRLSGTFKLWRPGRLRIDYAPPNGDFIVADGRLLYQWDSTMKQQSQTGIGDTLAGFILKRDLSFSGDDVTVTRVRHPSPQKVEVTLRSVKNPEAGEMTLLLDDVPLRLSGWRVLDAQGLVTLVSLHDVTPNAPMKKSEFVFRSPSFGIGTGTGTGIGTGKDNGVGAERK